MKVRLKNSWFAPTDTVQRDKIVTLSGRFFRAGIHEMPDDLLEFLPKSATVVTNTPKEIEAKEKASVTLKEMDAERAASDAFITTTELAEITLQERRDAAKTERVQPVAVDNLAKARAAKAAKAEARKKK